MTLYTVDTLNIDFNIDWTNWLKLIQLIYLKVKKWN